MLIRRLQYQTNHENEDSKHLDNQSTKSIPIFQAVLYNHYIFTYIWNDQQIWYEITEVMDQPTVVLYICPHPELME